MLACTANVQNTIPTPRLSISEPSIRTSTCCDRQVDIFADRHTQSPGEKSTHPAVLLGEEIRSVVQPFLLQRHKQTCKFNPGSRQAGTPPGKPARPAEPRSTRITGRKAEGTPRRGGGHPPSWLRAAGDRKWAVVCQISRENQAAHWKLGGGAA